MRNAHANGEYDKSSEDGALLQEHEDEAKAEGCGGREYVYGYGIQPDREGGLTEYLGSRNLHIPGVAAGSVRQ